MQADGDKTRVKIGSDGKRCVNSVCVHDLTASNVGEAHAGIPAVRRRPQLPSDRRLPFRLQTCCGLSVPKLGSKQTTR